MVFFVPVVMEEQPIFGQHSFPQRRRSPCSWRNKGPASSFLGNLMPNYYIIQEKLQEKQPLQKPTEDFEAKLAVKGFKPEEVEVKLVPNQRILVVTGKKEESEDGFKFVQNIQRSVFIPKGFNLDKIEAKFNKEGLLVIKAERMNKKQLEAEKKETIGQKEKMEVENGNTELEEKSEKKVDKGKEVVNVEIRTKQNSNETSGQTIKEFKVNSSQEVAKEEIESNEQEEMDTNQTEEIIKGIQDKFEQSVQKDIQEGIEDAHEESIQKDFQEGIEHVIQKSTQNGIQEGIEDTHEESIQDIQEEIEKGVQDVQDETFNCNVNLAGFSPENINVQISDEGHLMVSAHKEESDGGTSHMSRQFVVNREKFDLDQMTSNLSKDGILTISAPMRQKKKTISIPVKIIN